MAGKQYTIDEFTKNSCTYSCYNEALTIGKVVNDFKIYLPNAEIYVYDNNSKDDTIAIAKESGAIVQYAKIQGKTNVVFLISSSIPYLYYLFENEFSFYFQFIKRHFIIVIIPSLFSVLFQMYQFYLLTGDCKKGIFHLADAFSRRSSNGYSYEKNLSYFTTLKKIHLDIMTRYLGNSFMNNEILFVKLSFAIFITIGLLYSSILYKRNIERKLIRITWFSITALFSWFIIFKEHAHIHTHIDFFIWYCPFLLLKLFKVKERMKTL